MREAGKTGLNCVLLLGEVVDTAFLQNKRGGLCIRARLKMRLEGKYSSFAYADVYGRKSTSKVMALICQLGNIVYVEGEIRNATADRVKIIPYILVNKITLMLRRQDVSPPNTTRIMDVLDKLDPIGYLPDLSPRKRRFKGRRY